MSLNALESVAASSLVSSALLASLIPALVENGSLTELEVREIYENALLMLEGAQSELPEHMAPIYEAARKLIEDQLR